MVYDLELYYKSQLRWYLEHFRGSDQIKQFLGREELVDAIFAELRSVPLSLNLAAKQIHVSKYNPKEKKCVKKFTAIVCKAWCNLVLRDKSSKIGIDDEMIAVASYLAHQLVGCRLVCQ